MAIPQTFIQELLARADIVDIVGRYVQLKKGGANFMGLCPFHGEKSPSFSVSPSKQFFHCFGCGKNGNAIGFLMDHAGMSFVEAVQDLAQQFGMQVPQEDASPQDRARAQEQKEKQHHVDYTDRPAPHVRQRGEPHRNGSGNRAEELEIAHRVIENGEEDGLVIEEVHSLTTSHIRSSPP